MGKYIQRWGLLGVVALLVAACSGSATNKMQGLDMYAIPGGGVAPYDNDYYYRAPSTANDTAKRCNTIGDMPSCGGD